MSVTIIDIVLATLGLIVTGTLYMAWRSSSKPPLPPGPRRLPFIGNAHQMPSEYAWKVFAGWKAVYGDIIFLQLFNSPTLVLNTKQAARDLMVRRGAKYSGRPYSTWTNDLLDWQPHVGFMQSGEDLRRHRRWIQNPIFDKACLQQFPKQVRETHTLLTNILQDPENSAAHIHRFSGSIALDVFYGYRVTSSGDEILGLMDKVLVGVTAVNAPGVALVDFFPLMQHMLAWFPGASFKRLAQETRAALWEVTRKAYAHAKNANDSVIGALIEEHQQKGDLPSKEREIMVLGSIAYVGGTDTTRGVVLGFILAMVLHPRYYAKAQAEMDRVVGLNRCPTLEDRELLPYLECILREVYRWAPIGPLGVPHATSEDDQYDGYYIPKGTTVFSNIWLMLHNPDEYPDPESFMPERFETLSTEELDQIDPRNVVFGFGRRICPGRRFADTNIWLAMAHLVAIFDIEKARDSEGNEITPPVAFESGLSSPPLPFRCSMKPRSLQAQDLIRAAAQPNAN
ncbi:cytochrome P450 [Fomitopsis betulina]|nr:cytochrome P450 [Fomitopsis betulina]